MPRYWTGLVTAATGGFGRRSATGAGWKAVMGRAPEGYLFQRAVYLDARTVEGAGRAFELIWSAFNVLSTGYTPLDEYPELEAPGGQQRVILSASSVPRACVLAARASRSRQTTYALAMLAFSQGLASTHYADLDPSHWRHGPAITAMPRYHVRFAYALIAAYAVLEQLGLEVRASRQRPSRQGAQWDPAIRADLEARLRQARVDLSEPALWYARGTPRRTERGRPTVPLGTAPWARRRIRDQEVEVVDAVADLSWLRSRVASHRLGDLVPSLTYYDVANAQYLARRFLLSRLGLWRS